MDGQRGARAQARLNDLRVGGRERGPAGSGCNGLGEGEVALEVLPELRRRPWAREGAYKRSSLTRCNITLLYTRAISRCHGGRRERGKAHARGVEGRRAHATSYRPGGETQSRYPEQVRGGKRRKGRERGEGGVRGQERNENNRHRKGTGERGGKGGCGERRKEGRGGMCDE